jgi:DNA-binding CsgD family transcriptional regulator
MAECAASFSCLIEKLYKGPLEERPWADFLGQLQLQIASTSASLGLCPANSILPAYMVSTGDTSAEQKYGHDLFPANPFFDLPDGEVLAITEVVPLEEYEGSDFYKVFLQPYDVHHIIGVDIKMPGGATAQLRLVRSKAMGHYTPAERQTCKQLVVHLRQAFDIFIRLDRLSSQHDAYLSTLDLFPIGMFMLDRSGRILQKNGVAAQLLAEKNGLLIKHGCLAANRPNSAAKLHAAITAAANARFAVPGLASAISVERVGGKPNLSVMVRPAPRADELIGAEASAVIVLVNDPQRAQLLSARVIANLFGFTTAEAALAVLLTRGATLHESAEALSVSISTARTHLYSMFQKAGVNRQSQLVAHILRSFASWMDECA